MRRIVLSWSSGKDSAWALRRLRADPENEVVALLTTFNASADRVAMHAVRRELVTKQAAVAGCTLWPVELPWPCSNEEYEARMTLACERARAEGVTHVAFGDLHLAEIRAYREKTLAGTGLVPLFPLWGNPDETPGLAAAMLGAGVRAVVTCVDLRRLPAAFAGRWYDRDFVAELPGDVDPCGEQGEFHTFCFAGPMFSSPVDIRVGETVERDGFAFADVLSPRTRRRPRGGSRTARVVPS